MSIKALDSFKAAAARWNSIIVENQIIPEVVPEDFPSVDIVCGFLATNFSFEPETVFDHLFVVVEGEDIDGLGGTLFQSGPCAFEILFPIVGGIRYDTTDLEELENDGTLEDVVLHNLGHALGIGTSWRLITQGDIFLLQDPIFENTEDPGNTNAQPRFIGFNARQELSLLVDAPQLLASVPVQDEVVAGEQRFDVVAGEGRGIVDFHWDLDTFQNELMTFEIVVGEDHPLSRMTLRSMEDLGYIVDLDQADDFQLPVRGATSSSNQGLRKRHSLKNDVAVFINSFEDLRQRQLNSRWT